LSEIKKPKKINFHTAQSGFLSDSASVRFYVWLCWVTLREKNVEEADTAKRPVIFTHFNALTNLWNLCKAFFYQDV